MRRFEYLEPNTLDEAVLLLSRYGKADILAGGTDLLVEIKEHIRAPDFVVNMKKIPGLDRLNYDAAQGLRFGPLVTAREIETSPLTRAKYSALRQAASEIGSIQIRNRATVGGNICRASPSADTLPPLIAAGASARIYGPAGERLVQLEDFFTGPGKTVLAPNELVIEVTVPPPAPNTSSVYIKHGRRKAMELATVGVAVLLTRDGDVCRDIRIVLGAAAPIPIRAKRAEAILRGHLLNEQTIETAADTAMSESQPISNVRASASYRREMVRVLTKRAIAQMVAK